MDDAEEKERDAGSAYLMEQPVCRTRRSKQYECARPFFVQSAFLWIGLLLIVLGLIMAIIGFVQLQDGFYGSVGVLFTFLGALVAYAGTVVAAPYSLRPAA